MITIPDSERIRLETFLIGQAQRYSLTPEEYLRKIWYHEQASRLGEYVAMILLEELLPHSMAITSPEVVEDRRMVEA